MTAPMNSEQFTALLADRTRLVNERLTKHLTAGEHFGPPKKLGDAMRHAVMNGGKRLRPFLLIESGALFGQSPVRALDAACALEFIHCYSLVHDDLPAMDDDDLRRGQPTVHKAFDEATAILAGDALQSLAFEIIAAQQTHTDPAVRAGLAVELAKASGWAGMAGGQMLDLEREGEGGATRLAIIQRIHAMKTGALIEFAVVAGAMMGDAGAEDLDRMRQFGQILGQAYQTADDLLDATGETGQIGKTAGKDDKAGKATVVARKGVEKARKYLEDLETASIHALAPYGPEADALRQLVFFIASREH